MKIENHIAYRFLTDDVFWIEMLEANYPTLVDDFENDKNSIPSEALGFYNFLKITDGHVPRYVSKTVLEKLDHLKISRTNDKLDWTVFKNIPIGKFTYILPNNTVVRILFEENLVHAMYLYFNYRDGSKNNGVAQWNLIFCNRTTGERCDYVKTEKGSFTEEFSYKLLCFVHLSEISELVIEKGKKWGTRKQGKIINTLPFDILRIDSTWNVTSIRTDGFGVKGHFAIRWTGKGRNVPKVVFISPFQKKGYKRIAKKPN